MTNYYYSEHPDVEHQERRWNFNLLGNEFRFVTDNGVFSKRTVDFGSRTLLSALEATGMFENLQGTVLDVGCGYGPIGLALAKRYPQLTVEMIDVNHLALDLAKENAALNEINNVDIFASDVYARWIKKIIRQLFLIRRFARARKLFTKFLRAHLIIFKLGEP